MKFLEDVGYDGPRHFDAHAYRTEDYDGVKDFARGCMRTYLIMKEKAARWNADAEIQVDLASAIGDRSGGRQDRKRACRDVEAGTGADGSGRKRSGI